jgi:hypothetical protein
MQSKENLKNGFTNKTLVAHGCSYTYGCELENPSKTAFPVLVADKLGYNVDNLAIPGTSNEHILKDIVNYQGKIDLLLIAWTCETRFELGNYKGDVEKFGWNLIKPVMNKTLNKVLTTEYLNWDFYIDKMFHQHVMLQTYCEYHKIPYIFCYGIQNIHTLEKHRNTNSYIKSLINWNKWYNPSESFRSLTKGSFEYSWDDHPLEEGHAFFAENLYNFIISNVVN